MSGRLILSALLAVALSGCSSAAASFKEGEALEAQGDLEQAAAKFELACAEAPASPECQKSGARAAAALIAAADKAIAEGQCKKGERLLILALLDADEPTSKDIEARLAREDLAAGLRFEEAAADPDRARAYKTMESLAAGKPPLADKAKAWIEKERPLLLVAQVKAACGPEHEGSCAEAFAALLALPQKPAGFDEAKAAHDEEQKRTEKTRAEVERFLPVFAERGKKDNAFQKCMTEKATEISADFERARACQGEAYDDGKEPFERFDARQTEDSLFRRRLAAIGDPAIIASFEARRAEVISSGTYKKPEPKRAAGGGK